MGPQQDPPEVGGGGGWRWVRAGGDEPRIEGRKGHREAGRRREPRTGASAVGGDSAVGGAGHHRGPAGFQRARPAVGRTGGVLDPPSRRRRSRGSKARKVRRMPVPRAAARPAAPEFFPRRRRRTLRRRKALRRRLLLRVVRLVLPAVHSPPLSLQGGGPVRLPSALRRPGPDCLEGGGPVGLPRLVSLPGLRAPPSAGFQSATGGGDGGRGGGRDAGRCAAGEERSGQSYEAGAGAGRPEGLGGGGSPAC